jgi:hypothetical protein
VPRDIAYLKPARFKDYLTLSEVARAVNRDPSWIRLLEGDRRIPKAHRIQRGQVSVRLWSPAQVEEIKKILSEMRVGRPAKDG